MESSAEEFNDFELIEECNGIIMTRSGLDIDMKKNFIPSDASVFDESERDEDVFCNKNREIKKIQNNPANKKDMTGKGSENKEPESQFEMKMLKENILGVITVEKEKNIINIYPQNRDVLNTGDQLVDEDSKSHRKCESGNLYLEKENKCEDSVSNTGTLNENFQTNKSESSLRQTRSFDNSSSSGSSLVFIELENADEEINDLQLQEEIKESLTECETYSEIKMVSDNFTACDSNILDKSESDKDAPSQIVNDKMFLTDCKKQKKCKNVKGKFEENDVKLDKEKTSDGKLRENPILLSVLEDEIEDLREALETFEDLHTLRCEAFYDRISELEDFAYFSKPTSHGNTFKCKSRENHTKAQMKTSDTIKDSLPKSQFFKNNSIINTEQGTEYNESLIPVDTSTDMHTSSLNSQKCVCGFRNDFQSARKNFSSGDNLEDVKEAEKKSIGFSALKKEDLGDVVSNSDLKNPYLRDRYLLLYSKVPCSVTKEMGIVRNETKNGIKVPELARNSNATSKPNDSLRNYERTKLKPSQIHRGNSTNEYCRRRNMKSNFKGNPFKRYEDNFDPAFYASVLFGIIFGLFLYYCYM